MSTEGSPPKWALEFLQAAQNSVLSVTGLGQQPGERCEDGTWEGLWSGDVGHLGTMKGGDRERLEVEDSHVFCLIHMCESCKSLN